jgi:hypothetical protein
LPLLIGILGILALISLGLGILGLDAGVHAFALIGFDVLVLFYMLQTE